VSMRTIIAIAGTNELKLCATIEYEGRLWLVPEWLEAPAEGWRVPARRILLDSLRHEPAPPGYPAQWVVLFPIPKAFLDPATALPPAWQWIAPSWPDTPRLPSPNRALS
jgi:hypothetical protein